MLKHAIAGLTLIAVSMLPVGCRSAVPAAANSQQVKHRSSPREDKLQREAEKLAGPDAINCGKVSIYGDPTAATQCAMKAQAGGKPFRVRYNLQGIDSAVAMAIVRAPSGTISALMYDSDPAGTGYVGTENGRVSQQNCPVPVHLSITRSGRINCFPPDPSKQPDPMSPVLGPY